MKFFLVIALVFLVQTKTFAKKLVSHLEHKQDTSAKSIIDRLNHTAFNIYLESPDSARLIAGKALLLAEKAKYQFGIGRSFLNIGYIYWSQSYYPIALFYLNKALVNMPANKRLFISDAYTLKGRTYADLGDFKVATSNIQLAIRFAGHDPGRLGEVYSQKAYIYMRTKNYIKAIVAARQALILNKKANDQSNVAVLYGRLAGIYINEKEYKIALPNTDTAYFMSVKTHNNRLRANTYIVYASAYRDIKEFGKATVFAKKGLALADSIGFVDAISSAYKILIEINEQKNNLVQAMAYQKIYDKVRDSINVFENKKSTQLIQDYFALNARLGEIATVQHNNQDAKAKIKSKNTIIIILSLSLAIVLALLSITYYYYRQKKILSNQLNQQHDALLDQKQLIEAQTVSLKAISKVKDKLLTVIGHDLRTPLASLQNIIEMFEVKYLSTEEVHWLMKDINPLVKSAELTLANLMDWAGNQIKGRNFNATKLDIYLLGVEMEQTFLPALQRKNITFLNCANPGQSALADENHIKVILRNLIGNAIKFTDSNGSIKLTSQLVDNQIVISVEDNGKGMTIQEIELLFYMPTHFSQPGTLGETGVGIGLLLCKELVELNGGKLWVDSVKDKGSKFIFSLPMHPIFEKNTLG